MLIIALFQDLVLVRVGAISNSDNHLSMTRHMELLCLLGRDAIL
jgi:hypothetical protein